MEWIFQYVLFLAKVITFFAAIGAIAIIILSRGGRASKQGSLQLTNLGDQYRCLQEQMEQARLDEASQKVWQKQQNKKNKLEAKEKKQQAKTLDQEKTQKNAIYVIDFKGGVQASEVSALREEITAVISIATPQDEVLVRLESQGGVIHGYGLAASQLQRLRDRKIHLTVAVDKVAASGGYMMACVAEKIVSAPFAIIGSVGVIAQLPNFHRLLKKNDIDIELHTAGEFKRTLTLFGENTAQGREKFREELNHAHLLFKQFIQQNRPQLDVESIATGEHWFGSQALSLGLVDKISTSDDLILNAIPQRDVIKVTYTQRKRLLDRFVSSVFMGLDKFLLRWWERGQKTPL